MVCGICKQRKHTFTLVLSILTARSCSQTLSRMHKSSKVEFWVPLARAKPDPTSRGKGRNLHIRNEVSKDFIIAFWWKVQQITRWQGLKGNACYRFWLTPIQVYLELQRYLRTCSFNCSQLCLYGNNLHTLYMLASTITLMHFIFTSVLEKKKTPRY